jgi:CrcB protein
MNWIVIAAVAIGGALGSVLRYSLASLIQPSWWPGFPFGIFTVNITGGLIMGLITELAAILGGYTTFSTFSLDSALLIQRGSYAQASFYVAGSVILSILALFAGLWIVRALYA